MLLPRMANESRESGGVPEAADRRVSLTDFRWVFIWGSTAVRPERSEGSGYNVSRSQRYQRCMSSSETSTSRPDEGEQINHSGTAGAVVKVEQAENKRDRPVSHSLRFAPTAHTLLSHVSHSHFLALS